MSRILVIDDDPYLRRAYMMLLTQDGHEVLGAEDWLSTAQHLHGEPFDAIVSDLSLPGLRGTDVLALIRQADPAVPVIVVTGDGSVESASRAYEYSVYRYLLKPFDPTALREVVTHAASVHAKSRGASFATPREQDATTTVDRRDLTATFERALASTWLAVQPICDVIQREVVAYEALLRCNEDGLRRPDDFLRTAFALGRFQELSRIIRARAANLAGRLPRGRSLYVNLHPTELNDPSLFDGSDGLGQHAERIVLEITERTALSEIADLADRLALLRAQGFRIAIDDMGAGYAGLSALTALAPDVVKIDMSLIRDVETSPMKRTIVSAMAGMCAELGLPLVAEGVETPAECAVLSEVGISWMQGYLFAKPQAEFSYPTL